MIIELRYLFLGVAIDTPSCRFTIFAHDLREGAMFHLLQRDLWMALLSAGIGGMVFAALCALGQQARRALWPRPDARPGTAVRADELEGVEGIGPNIAALLRRANITSYAALANHTPAQLRQILAAEGRFRTADPASWPLQAELLRDGWISAFLVLAVALRGGAPRLEDVHGIGEAIGAHLRKIGIQSPADLASADPDGLVSRLAPALPRVSHQEARQWIDDAQALHRGDREALLRLAALRVPASADPGAAADPSDPIAKGAGPQSRSVPTVAPSLGDCFVCTALPAALLALLALFLGQKETVAPTPPGPACIAPKVCMVAPVTPPTTPVVVYRRKIPATGTFRFNEYRQTSLTAEGTAKLTALVTDLKARLAEADHPQPTAVVIVGHADRIGSQGANQLLSERRANAVETYLEEQLGWPSDVFFSYGRGELTPDPLAHTSEHCPPNPTAADADCYAPDRRVEVTVVF
jgi:outer membrane protein OmpA-like peptidoglycan-associated protein/predicted flap endonuclease-1-like 5' DNA nuclease